MNARAGRRLPALRVTGPMRLQPVGSGHPRHPLRRWSDPPARRIPGSRRGVDPTRRPDVLPARRYGVDPACRPDVLPAPRRGVDPARRPDVLPARRRGVDSG